MVTPRDRDAAKWAAALHLAAGHRPPNAAARLRHQRSRMIWIALAIVLVALIAVVLLSALVRRHTLEFPHSAAATGPRTALGYSMIGAGLLLGVLVLAYRVRSGAARVSWESPVLLLTPRQQRLLRRQLRGRQPLDQAAVPLVRSLALRIVRQRSLFGLWIAFPLFFLGMAVLSATTFGWAVAGALLVVYLLTAVPLVSDLRRARDFLARHPAAASDVTTIPLGGPGPHGDQEGVDEQAQ